MRLLAIALSASACTSGLPATDPPVDAAASDLAACPAGACVAVRLADGRNRPKGIAVDGTSVYWVDSADDQQQPGAGALVKMPKTGGAPTTLIDRLNQPYDLVVDGSALFWTNFGNPGAGSVMRCDLDGGNRRTLSDGENAPTGIALDADYVYYTLYGLNEQGVKRVPRDGGATALIAADVEGVGALAVAVADGDVFWILRGPPDSPTLRKLPRDGAPLTLATGNYAHRLALDDTFVYFTDDVSLHRVPRGGGDDVLLDGPRDFAFNFDVILDGDFVYWTRKGAVMRALRAGGNAETIAQGAYPGFLAVDDAAIYWTDFDDGSVWRIAK